VEKKEFIAACGSHDLPAIVSIFRDWVDHANLEKSTKDALRYSYSITSSAEQAASAASSTERLGGQALPQIVIFQGLQGIEWVILRDRSGGSGCG
jgi:hypothetical protein